MGEPLGMAEVELADPRLAGAGTVAITRPGGMIVAIGVPPDGTTVSLPGQQGRLPLGKLTGKRYRLDEVNEAFGDTMPGSGGRAVLKLWGKGDDAGTDDDR